MSVPSPPVIAHPSGRRLAGLLVLAAVAVAPAPAPAQLPDVPIVGGKPATRAYPHQALLEIELSDGRRIRCGGTLLAARYVLTAAHCMNSEGRPAVKIDVSLGQTDVTAPARNFSVADWQTHPSYVPSNPGHESDGGYDVAVLRLDRPAEFEQARLLRPADAGLWAGGVTATVIGWGLTEDEAQNGARSNQLREVALPVYSDPVCAAEFKAVGAPDGFFDPTTMLCAGGKEGKDACDGDSGGPLLVPDGQRFALAGVVSFGAVFRDDRGNERACAENVPGVYSRIAADPLNAWVRSLVPQVEIDAVPAQPEPGQQVSLTASGTNPNGGYDLLEWDLDADGAFDDAIGPDAAVTALRGATTVAVRATRGLGEMRDQEVRRIDVVALMRSGVGFSRPAMTVEEGDPVVITLTKDGSGGGSVAVTPIAGTADLTTDLGPALPATVGFAADQTLRTVSVPTLEDATVEGPETLTLDLTGYSGEIVAGAPTRLTVTITDDDVRPRIIGLSRVVKGKRGRVKLKYRITTAATVVLGITDARGRRLLAVARRQHSRPGTYTTTVQLRRRAKRLLRTRRAVGLRAVYAIFDGKDLLDSRIRKVTLRR